MAVNNITELITAGQALIEKYPDNNDLSILFDTDYYTWVQDGKYFLENSNINYMGNFQDIISEAYSQHKTNRQAVYIIMGCIKHLEPYIDNGGGNDTGGDGENTSDEQPTDGM